MEDCCGLPPPSLSVGSIRDQGGGPGGGGVLHQPPAREEGGRGYDSYVGSTVPLGSVQALLCLAEGWARFNVYHPFGLAQVIVGLQLG
jgi:hypothetical protein